MLDRDTDKRVQKSSKGRFLLVMGVVFFAMYFFLGLAVIFWKNLPIQMEMQYRIAFGILLIVYSFIRFVRLIQKNKS